MGAALGARGALWRAGIIGLAVASVGCGALGTSDTTPQRGTVALGRLPERTRPGAPTDAYGGGVARAVHGPASAAVPAVREPRGAADAVAMAFTGDTLMHSPIVRLAAVHAGGDGHDFTPMFARVAPLLGAADLAVCHLETPIAPPGEALSTAPRYGVPAALADSLATAGFDRCSTASNHTLDRGIAGIDATIAALAAAGLDQSGMAADPRGIEPHVFDLGGVAVAHLSYTAGFNGIPLPADEPWRSALIDPARILADAATARARGAQLVVVSLHWGVEGVSAVSDEQRAVAEAITATGQIDLIVGHHAHVLQPIERVNGVWVVYGLSNLISNLGQIPGWPAGSADAAIATVEFVRQPDGRYVAGRPVVLPTWVDAAAGWVIRPVLGDLADPQVPEWVKPALAASLARTTQVLGDFLPPA